MRRSSLLKLRDKHWIEVDGDSLRCAVVPSAGGLIGTLALLGSISDDVVQEICTRAFVDFKGYYDDDGSEIANTLEARMEIYGWQPARRAINEGISKAHERITEGEPVAASV